MPMDKHNQSDFKNIKIPSLLRLWGEEEKFCLHCINKISLEIIQQLINSYLRYKLTTPKNKFDRRIKTMKAKLSKTKIIIITCILEF